MRALLWIGLPLVLVQGCAGSPVGEQLERSFDSPSVLVPEREEAGARSNTTSNVEAASKREPKPKPVAVAQPPSAQGGDKDTVAASDTVAEDDNEGIDSKPADPQVKISTPGGGNTSTPQPAGAPGQDPQPYRITIRLAGADPAAPAEAVTRALRGSDVRFAVERIERIEAATTTPAPLTAPTLAPPPTAP